MPKGLRRWYGGDDLHYITCSCYQRKPFLGSAPRRDLFLKIFEEVRVCHPDRARTSAARRVRVEGSRDSFLRHADLGSSLENAISFNHEEFRFGDGAATGITLWEKTDQSRSAVNDTHPLCPHSEWLSKTI